MFSKEVKEKQKINLRKAMTNPDVHKKRVLTRLKNSGGEYGSISGKDHYNWKGGKSKKKYGEDWNYWKEFILERDGHMCFICKTLQKLEVHHLIPIRTASHNVLNEPLNLITLCKSCHMKEERTGIFNKNITNYLNSWFTEIKGGLSCQTQIHNGKLFTLRH